MSEAVITTRDLKKTYKARGKGKPPVEAVRGISFEVRSGEIFGLLGPNGAGKTTTMRMLSTLLTPTSGEARVVGGNLYDNQEPIRRKIGYISQVGGMQRESTGRENLMLQAQLYGMSKKDAKARVDEVIKTLHVEEYADRRTGTYSGGQRRMFDLASGIVHKPTLLFLDEPSTGLDPQNRAHVWSEVKRLNKEGVSVIVTTHYMDEADNLCDRIAIVDHGKIVALDTPANLKTQMGVDTLDKVFLKITGHSMEEVAN